MNQSVTLDTTASTASVGGVDDKGDELDGNLDLDLKDADKSDSDFDDDDNLLDDDSILKGTPINGFWKPHYSLYIQTGFSHFTERMCEFAIFYCLSIAFKNSTVLVATYGLIPKVMRLILTPQINGLIGKYPRLQLMIVATLVHTLLLTMVVVLVLVINLNYAGALVVPWSNAGFVVTFVFVLVFGIFSELADMLVALSVSSDWIQVIANSKYSLNPGFNEMSDMRGRAILICKVIAPIIWGCFFYFTSTTVSLSFLIAWNLASGVLESFFVNKLHKSYPDLVTGRVAPSTMSGERIDENEPMFSLEPFRVYYAQSSFLASMGFVLLGISVLVPGCLVINYLVYFEASIFEIVSLQSMGAGIGIFGTLIAPKLIEWLGLSKCALISLWIYFLLVVLAFVQVPTKISVWMLIVPLVLSRVFYWAFELTEKQILKESILTEENILVKVQIMEYQFSTLVSLLSCSFAILSVSPSQFTALCGATLGISFIGVCLFTLWYRTHGHSHQLSTILG